LLEWLSPLYSAGHWVPQQIHAAGFRSTLGQPQDHSSSLTWEVLGGLNPDGIGLICCGYGLEENIEFAKAFADQWNDEIGTLPPLWAFDANGYFSRPTLAIVEGARLLRRAFEEDTEVKGKSKRI